MINCSKCGAYGADKHRIGCPDSYFFMSMVSDEGSWEGCWTEVVLEDNPAIFTSTPPFPDSIPDVRKPGYNSFPALYRQWMDEASSPAKDGSCPTNSTP